MYEYYTFPGSAEVLVQIFNSVAMICGGNDYAGIMQVAALLGLMVVLVIGVFKLDLKESFVYIFVVCAVWMVMMVPKVRVTIVETSGHNMSAVAYNVDNVPFGLAISGHFISRFGVWMTKEAEMVNSLPNDLQYSETGVLFGNRLIRQLHGTNLSDQLIQDDWTLFMDQCAFYDINFYHKYSLADLLDSSDIMTTLGNTNRSLYTAVTDPATKNKKSMSCKNAYASLYVTTNSNVINQVLPDVAQRGLGMLGWTQNNVGPNYASVYSTMGDSALQYMFKSASIDSMDAIRQAAMINMLKNAEIRNASATNNQQRLSVALATAQAERQWIMSQQTGGAQASGFLPVMRATLEGILIGLFPFVMFISLLGGIMAFKSIMFYVMTLFWLQLWAPLASIMNLMVSSHSQNNVYSNLYGQDSATLRNSFGILQAAVEGEAMAGYAYWLIPMLSFAIVYGGKGLGNAMIGMVGSGQNVGNAAGSEVAKGNISMGNVSYNNTSANKSSADVVYTDPAIVGARSATGSYSWNAGQEGTMRASATRNDLPVSSQATIKASDSYSQQASQSLQAAQSQSATASAATTLGNAYTMGYASKVGMSSSAGQEMMSGLSAKEQKSVNEILQSGQRLSDTFRVGNSSITSSALSLGLGVKANGGSDAQATESVTKFLSSSKSKAGVGASLDSRGEASNRDELARAVMNEVTALQQRNVQYTSDMGKQMSSNQSFREAASSGDELATNATASYSTAESATLSAQQSYQQAQSYQESAQKAAESGATITVDTSHATGQQYLGSGGNLGQMYAHPTADRTTVQAAGQSALNAKKDLEHSTAGSDYQPAHTLKSSDIPVNTVGAVHTQNANQLGGHVSSTFDGVQKQATDAGLSTGQVKSGIATQKSDLSGQMNTASTETKRNIDRSTTSMQQDGTNLKSQYSDAMDATSPFQALNTYKVQPGSKSDGSTGSAADMAKDVGQPAVEQTQFVAPGSQGARQPFTREQQKIQADNAQTDHLTGIRNMVSGKEPKDRSGSGGGVFTFNADSFGKKENNDGPKP